MSMDRASSPNQRSTGVSERDFLYEHEVYERMAVAGLGTPPRWRLVSSAGIRFLPGTLVSRATEGLPPANARSTSELDVSSNEELRRRIDEALLGVPGERVVLKIVHPRIVHKTEMGGVRIVDRSAVHDAVAAMLQEVPTRLAASLEDNVSERDDRAQSLANEMVGVLVVEKVQGASGFGTELFVGVRQTREFGPILNLGVGGTQTEMLARIARADSVMVTASPLVAGDESIWNLFARTVSHAALCKGLRGQLPCASEAELRRVVEGWCAYIREDAGATRPSLIAELEVNPFVFSEDHAIPLDGMLRFGPRPVIRARPPREQLRRLFHPSTVGLVGVSSKGPNVGRIILGNLLAGGFDPARLAIVKTGESRIDGVSCVPSVADLPWRCDLFIISIAAHDVPACVEDLIRYEKAEAILLITGGMGETKGGASIESEISRLIADARAASQQSHEESAPASRESRVKEVGPEICSSSNHSPVLVGGNSLGILSRPGKLDTLFIPEAKLPRRPGQALGQNVAILSQSGAFLITRQSSLGGFVPRYAASTGNQVDVGIADLVAYMAEEEDIAVIGCYVEGFRDGEGLDLALATREAVARGKQVLVYKAGRTVAGRTAAQGHTAALAGDWDVARAVLSSAGAIFCSSFREWSSVLLLSSLLSHRSPGRGRLAAVSNAGYESVGLADHLASGSFLQWARFGQALQESIRAIFEKHGLAGLQDVRNPLDVTPMANDTVHLDVLEALEESDDVDVLIAGCVPLTAAMKTTKEELGDSSAYANQLVKRFAEDPDRARAAGGRIRKKPMVVVVDSGAEYDAMVDVLSRAGMPVFRSADEAVSMLDRWATAASCRLPVATP